MPDEKGYQKTKAGKGERGILANRALATPSIKELFARLAAKKKTDQPNKTKKNIATAYPLLRGTPGSGLTSFARVHLALEARRLINDPIALADEFNRLEGVQLDREETAIAVLVEAGLLSPDEGAKLALKHMRARSGE